MDKPTRIGLGGTALATMVAAPFMPWWVTALLMLVCVGVAVWGLWPLIPKFASRADERAPLWKAVEHVRNSINDTDAKQVYPTARAALRQAALDGRIHIYGHKSERPLGEGGNYSAVSTLIPQVYWESADIGPLATEAQWADRFDCHTFPHKMSGGSFGDPIELYAKCAVIWREVAKQGR